MRQKIAELTPEERNEYLSLFFANEVIRSTHVPVDRDEAMKLMMAERALMERIMLDYDLDGEENWQIDPVDCCIYYGAD